MKQKILFVGHCILNTASKVVMFEAEDMAAEEKLRVQFLHAAIDAGIQLVQLACPEYTLYGCRRWGHTSNQFDNPFFRAHCRRLLEPVMLELEEYLSAPERFEVLGFVGIDGSPSCGVDYTCVGPWGANLSGREDLAKVIADVKLISKQGVFFQELATLLEQKNLSVPVTGLFAPEPDKVMNLIGVR